MPKMRRARTAGEAPDGGLPRGLSTVPGMPTTHAVAFRPPFDLTRTLAFVRGFSPMHGEQVVEGERLTKAMAIDGRAIVYRVEPAASREASSVTVHLHEPEPLSNELRSAALVRIAA